MNRTWTDFKAIHGNISGARIAFEDACGSLFYKKHEGQFVSQVKCKQGDGGIDVFVGNPGVEPITVIQCKFFLDSIGESQKSQIRESFKTARDSSDYSLKEWILCVPTTMTLDESSWWAKWKQKHLDKYAKDNGFIKLINGNQLIDLLKEHNLYDHVFKMKDSILIEEIHKVLVPQPSDNTENAVSQPAPNLVLFNNYSAVNESYYLSRLVDSEFIKALAINNVWLYGDSGTGKTALINRNLIMNSVKYCFCDMSPITINSADDVLNEIVYSLEDAYGITRISDTPNLLKQISFMLTKCDSSSIVIVIDELSIDDTPLLIDIASNLLRLVTHYANKSTRDTLRFVVSTIRTPNSMIQNKPKALDHFQYISCGPWGENLPKLFDLICNGLNLQFDDARSLILKSSDNSPRVLKSIFRKLIIAKDQTSHTIEKAIRQTLEERV